MIIFEIEIFDIQIDEKNLIFLKYENIAIFLCNAFGEWFNCIFSGFGMLTLNATSGLMARSLLANILQ